MDPFGSISLVYNFCRYYTLHPEIQIAGISWVNQFCLLWVENTICPKRTNEGRTPMLLSLPKHTGTRHWADWKQNISLQSIGGRTRGAGVAAAPAQFF